MLVSISFVCPLAIHTISADTIEIDVGRYFLDVEKGIDNPKKQVNRIVAMGQQAVYGDLAKFGDADNGRLWKNTLCFARDVG